MFGTQLNSYQKMISKNKELSEDSKHYTKSEFNLDLQESGEDRKEASKDEDQIDSTTNHMKYH